MNERYEKKSGKPETENQQKKMQEVSENRFFVSEAFFAKNVLNQIVCATSLIKIQLSSH